MKGKTVVQNSQSNDLDLGAMELLMEVARHGSFSAVARDRRVDPSVISRAIGSLEAKLGSRLFQRTTRRVVLTASGKAFIDAIAPAVETIKHATQVAADASNTPRGTLRITAPVSFGQRCIVPLMPSFLDAYPELTVDLVLTDTVVDLVMEKMDVAIRLGSLRDSTLAAKRLVRTKYVVCASTAYLKRCGRPAVPRDIENHNCLLFALPGFRSRWKFGNGTGAVSEVSVSGHFITSNALALLHCACAGSGIALLPTWLVSAELKTGQLVDLFPQYNAAANTFETGVWLMHPSRHQVPAKVRAYSRFLQTHLSAHGA